MEAGITSRVWTLADLLAWIAKRYAPLLRVGQVQPSISELSDG